MANGGAAELFLRQDRVQVAKQLDVAVDDSQPAAIQLDPTASTIDVGGQNSNTGGRIAVGTSGSTEVGSLSARNGTGSLDLANGTGNTVVSLRGDTATGTRNVEVTKPGAGTQATIQTESSGGRLRLFHNRQNDPVVDAGATRGGGMVALDTANGETTCQLLGGDAALVLSGTAEQDNRDRVNPEWGGGEVVLSDYAPSGSNADIRIHAKGERGSDYGVDDNNRPRINIDGATATIELGREHIDQDRPGVDGHVRVIEDGGETVLEMRVEREVTRSAPYPGGELEFRWVDSQGAVQTRGTIQAHPDGLMFYDSADNPAMLLTQRGTIETRTQISEGTL